MFRGCHWVFKHCAGYSLLGPASRPEAKQARGRGDEEIGTPESVFICGVFEARPNRHTSQFQRPSLLSPLSSPDPLIHLPPTLQPFHSLSALSLIYPPLHFASASTSSDTNNDTSAVQRHVLQHSRAISRRQHRRTTFHPVYRRFLRQAPLQGKWVSQPSSSPFLAQDISLSDAAIYVQLLASVFTTVRVSHDGYPVFSLRTYILAREDAEYVCMYVSTVRDAGRPYQPDLVHKDGRSLA